MQLDTNKAMVTRWFRCIEEDELDDMFAMISDDCHIWDPYGDVSKDQLRSVIETVNAKVDGKIKLTIVSMTAESDRVVAEVESAMLLKDGTPYENRYCWLFRVANSQFLTIKEYTDTRPSATILAS